MLAVHTAAQWMLPHYFRAAQRQLCCWNCLKHWKLVAEGAGASVPAPRVEPFAGAAVRCPPVRRHPLALMLVGTARKAVDVLRIECGIARKGGPGGGSGAGSIF
jgi:hypothetical protein